MQTTSMQNKTSKNVKEREKSKNEFCRDDDTGKKQTKRDVSICDCSIKCNNARMHESGSSEVDKIDRGFH